MPKLEQNGVLLGKGDAPHYIMLGGGPYSAGSDSVLENMVPSFHDIMV